MIATRLIPKDPDTQPTIFDAAQANSWRYLKRVKADPDNFIPGESIFQPEGATTTIHYVDDFVSEVIYVLLKGEDLEDLEDVAWEVRQAIPIFTIDEILQLYPNAKTQAEKIKAIRRTGLAAPGAFDKRFFDVFHAALTESEPQIRQAAVRMTAYLGWPELINLLTPLQENDPDEDVRKRAENILSAMKAAQGNK